MTQMLLADGERLPQAENLRNLRNLCNLCDAKSTLILSAIRWEALFSPKNGKQSSLTSKKLQAV